MKKTILLCGLLAASCSAPSAGYTAADRATYEAIAPQYLAYVAADTSLDEAQKQRRALTVTTWRMRLEAAEADK